MLLSGRICCYCCPSLKGVSCQTSSTEQTGCCAALSAAMAKHGGREAQEAPEGQMEPKVKEEAERVGQQETNKQPSPSFKANQAGIVLNVSGLM